MWYPKTRVDWLKARELFAPFPKLQAQLAPEEAPEEAIVIERNADWLLQALYEPRDHGCGFSHSTARRLGLMPALEEEAINSGDLQAEVQYCDEHSKWCVIIEEANPSCPALQGYISHWLGVWGWPGIEVRTEW